MTGRGRIGADGLAFWFTSTKGFEGPVFGSSDKWNGLGIFFDSFDNDNKHNNPYIMSMLNDGNKVYDHQHDGSTQQLAGCLRDFRNKPFPVKARIEYFRNVLTVIFKALVQIQLRGHHCLNIDLFDVPTMLLGKSLSKLDSELRKLSLCNNYYLFVTTFDVF